MNIEIRILQESEHQKANDFFNRIHNRNRLLEFFEWEFFKGPAGKAIYIVAEDRDVPEQPKIIGLQCAIPIYMHTSDGEKILTAKSEDTLVDPAYRGKNIFKLMYDLLFEKCSQAGIKYIWGFTSAVKPFSKLGFELPCQFKRGFFVIRPFEACHSLLKHNLNNTLKQRTQIAGLTFLSKLLSIRSLFISKSIKDFKIISDEHESKTEIFYRAVDSKNKYLFLYQNRDYLQWRITENPYPIKYGTLQLIDTKGIVFGDIVYSISEKVGYIEQILIDKQLGENIKVNFLKNVIEKIKTHNVLLIRFLGFDNNDINKAEIDLLKKIGFVFVNPDKSTNWFVWKTLGEKDKTIQPENIILSKLYSEGN